MQSLLAIHSSAITKCISFRVMALLAIGTDTFAKDGSIIDEMRS